MGNIISLFAEPVKTAIIKKRKRETDLESEDDIEESMKIPKKKKLNSTALYIYETLFKEGKDSDIKVIALNEIWNLHKLYLSQSPYFNSMFGGSWKEAYDNEIRLEITDNYITVESLSIVFGSFYFNEISIQPNQACSIVAIASLFQMNSLIEKCSEIMCENMNVKTVISYYNCAVKYQIIDNVKEQAFKWLLLNLFRCFFRHKRLLLNIPTELMMRLIEDKQLIVVQTEFQIYILLRYWMYFILFPSKGDQIDNESLPAKYFRNLPKDLPFLQKDEGKQFQEIFKKIRYFNTLLNKADYNTIVKDNIVPKEWIYPVIEQLWNKMITIDGGWDLGPNENHIKYFDSHCIRLGRVFSCRGSNHIWRWMYFFFGLDLVFSLNLSQMNETNEKCLYIKRSFSSNSNQLISNSTERSILLKLRLVSLDERGRLVHEQNTEVTVYKLDKSTDYFLLKLDEELEYPIILSCHLMVASEVILKDS